jgi:hypothetical protein
MKLLWIAVLSLLVVFGASAAHANTIPIDPIIRTGGDPPAAPAGIITPDFTIVSPTGTSPGAGPAGSPCLLYQFGFLTSTSPACLFENDINLGGIGEAITQLSLDISSVSPTSVSCGFLAGSPFGECAVAPLAGGGTMVLFSQGSIPFHSDFTLEFEGFPNSSSFSTTASIPEPGTLALLLGGIGALGVGRKLRFR